MTSEGSTRNSLNPTQRTPRNCFARGLLEFPWQSIFRHLGQLTIIRTVFYRTSFLPLIIKVTHVHCQKMENAEKHKTEKTIAYNLLLPTSPLPGLQKNWLTLWHELSQMESVHTTSIHLRNRVWPTSPEAPCTLFWPLPRTPRAATLLTL